MAILANWAHAPPGLMPARSHLSLTRPTPFLDGSCQRIAVGLGIRIATSTRQAGPAADDLTADVTMGALGT